MGVTANYYFSAHPDAARSGLSAAEHYARTGWTLGYDPNPYFSTSGYLAANPDVASHGVNPLQHYATNGAQEGRSPSVLFDATFYLAQNPDVAAAGVNPLQHFIQIGLHEGRDPNVYFSVQGYLAANPDVAAAGVDPYAHYLNNGWHEGRDPSPQFDTSWYLAQNPDVAAAGVNPLQHFIQIGLHEGRDPNAYFSVQGYLAANPDVAAAGVDPYAHYLNTGWHEGRDPSLQFDTSWYLEQYPDVAAAGVNPLQHFIQVGLAEHRVPVEPVLSAGAASADERSTVTYTYSSPGMPAGTVYSYALSGVQAEDVTGPLTGTITLDSHGQAQVMVTLVADSTTEGAEQMVLTIGGVVAMVAVEDTSPQTQYFLTAGTDSIFGSLYDDTFTSTVAGGFADSDRIDGGEGMDTLVVTDTPAVFLEAFPILTDVETARISSSEGEIFIDTTAWAGLQTLELSGIGGPNNITVGTGTSVTAGVSLFAVADTVIEGGKDVTLTLTGTAPGGVTVGNVIAPTGAVSVSSTKTTDGSMAEISVTGGTTVAITQAAANPVDTTVTMGEVTVNGTAATTAVSVTAADRATASDSVAGVTVNRIQVTDVNAGSETLAGTITSVTAANYTTLGITDNALTTLSLSGGSGNIIIDNSGLITPTNLTLGATLDGLTGGTMDDADVYTTLNVTTAGRASTLANITLGAMTSLNLAGDKVLTLTSTAGMSALQTVTVSGEAGINADLSGWSVTGVDTSDTTGTSTITVNADRASFTGGAGVDRVTLSAGTIDHALSLGDGDDRLNLGSQSAIPGAALSGGTGTDTLTMTAALAATASGDGAFAAQVTGFEKLVLTGATNQTIDLAVLGIPDDVATSGGNGLTLSNLTDGGTLNLTGAGTAYTVANSAFIAGAEDTLHLVLTDGSGAGVAFASTGITASRVEHVTIDVQDNQAEPSGTFNDAVSLLGNSSHSIAVTGNAGLTLTATSTALISVDASGITLGGFTWTSGALASAATIHGSAGGTNAVDFSAATQAVDYTGGSGDDAVTGTNGRAGVIDLGSGNNSFVGSGGNHTVTAGDGSDTVVLTSGNNTVSLGDGTNAFTATSGSNTYVGGAGTDMVALGGGMNHVALGAGNDTISITAPGANLNIYTTVADFGDGDNIIFTNLGTETFNSTKMVLGQNAVFQDYANAVVAAGGNASVNGAFGWFQFGSDTYLVESRHDGSGFNAEFINGVDMIVELTGLTDLSTANLVGDTFYFGIT